MNTDILVGPAFILTGIALALIALLILDVRKRLRSLEEDRNK